MNVVEKKLVNLYKHKKIVSILTLILILLSGFLNKNVYAYGKLIWPVPKHGNVSSRFKEPGRPTHMGLDIPAPKGTKVIAAADGVVQNIVLNHKTGGNMFSIKHSEGYVTNYLHNSKILVREGQHVKQGDVIAEVGNTGEVKPDPGGDGSHLHFEVLINGNYVNPEREVKYDASIEPGTNPVGDEPVRNDYMDTRDPREFGSGYAENGLNTITNENFFYQGAPKGHYQARGSFLNNIINFIATIGEYLISLFINIVLKIPVLGYASLAEVMITNIFNSVAGEDEYINRGMNTDLYIDPRRSVNVENIIFGRVELLNVDFFIDPRKAEERMEGLTGSGQEIERIQERARISGNSGTATEYNAVRPEYEESVIGALRTNYSKIYYITFAICIVTMLLTLVGISIAGMLSTLGKDKAKYKEYGLDWIKGFATMFFSLLFVFFIIKFNNFILKILMQFSNTILEDGILKETASIYETIRTRAYDNKFTVGFPATIIYIMLIWDTIKFSFIYVKRLIYILVLALIGPLGNTYQVVSNVFTGKAGDRTVISKWAKEISYLVFLQSIHAAVYTFIMIVAFQLLQNISIVNFILVVGLHNMLYKMQDYLKDLFKFSDGSGSAISDTVKTNPVKEGRNIAAAVTGKEMSKDLVGAAYKDTKKIIVGASKKAGHAAKETVRGGINFGLFMHDALNKEDENTYQIDNVDNIDDTDDEEFTEETKKYREERINELVEISEAAGVDDPTLRAYLNTLSNSNLEDMFANQELLFTKGPTYKEREQNAINQRALNIEAAIKDTKPYFLDEHGRYRILAPIKTYNTETGKYETLKPGSKEYFKNLAKAFDIDSARYKEAGTVMVNTLKTGLSIIGAALVIPEVIGDVNLSKDLLNTWVGMQAFGNSKGKSKKNAFVQTKEDIIDYLLAYKKEKKNKKVKDAITRIKTKLKNDPDAPINYLDARIIIDNAKNEIINMQKEDIERRIPDISKKDFKRAKRIKKSEKYRYIKRGKKDEWPKELRLRKEQNDILEELKDLDLQNYEDGISKDLNYIKTYLKLTEGSLDRNALDEYFNKAKLDKENKELKIKSEIYGNIKKINEKVAEAKLYGKSDKEIEKIRAAEIVKLEAKLDKKAITPEDKKILEDNKNLMYLTSEELKENSKQFAKAKEKLLDQNTLNEILDKNEDKTLEEFMNDYDKNIDNIKLNPKLSSKQKKEKEESFNKNISKLADIYEESVEVETLKKMGKKEFEEAKNIKDILFQSILQEKREIIDNLNISDTEKEKMLKSEAEKINVLNLKSSELQKYLSKEEQIKFEKYAALKKESIKDTKEKEIKDLINDWKTDSKEIAKGIEKLTKRYNEELDKRTKIKHSLKDPMNLHKVYENAVKNKTDNLDIKFSKDIRTDAEKLEEDRKRVKQILDKFYRK